MPAATDKDVQAIATEQPEDGLEHHDERQTIANIELGDVEKTTDNSTTSIHQVQSRSSHLPLSTARTVALVITLTGAAFLNTLSVQACVIILPTIGRDLGVPLARQQWIVSSYSLAFGCFLLLWGRLADVYGKRLIFILGSLWVAIMTLVCPFMPDEIGFNVMRGLQGLGAAANVPTAIGILGVTFTPGKAKNYAFATYSSGAPLGSVFGNLLGGIVGQYASWRWVFWVLAIFAFAVTIAGHFLIPLPVIRPTESEVKSAVDWIGGTMITVALFILLFALTEGNVVGWSKPYIPAIMVLAVVLLACFITWQLYLEKKTTRRPLVKLSIFKNTKVAAAMFAMGAFFSSFNAFLVFATYFWQLFQGLSPIQTTLRFIPTGPTGIIVSFITARLLAHVKVNYIVLFGLSCCVFCCLLFAVPIPPTTTYWAYGFPATMISVCGADTLFPSLVLFNAHNLPKEDQALGGALINAVGQVGRSIGLAIAIAIQVAVTGESGSQLHNPAFLSGLRAGMWFNAGLAATAFCVVAVTFSGAGVMGGSKK